MSNKVDFADLRKVALNYIKCPICDLGNPDTFFCSLGAFHLNCLKQEKLKQE